MIVSINQPAYLPWLGYFDRIRLSELHVVLDHVQFEKNSFVNRNRIRTAQGSTWLTVPVRTGGRFGSLAIDSLEIANDNWRRKHWAGICQAYAKAPFFDQHAAWLEPIYQHPWERLAPMMDAINTKLMQVLGITTPLRYSSQMKPNATKSELVLELCQSVGATVYLSGPLGRDYLDQNAFQAAGIKVQFHDYTHPVYGQIYPGFEPYMSIIDLLFMQGPDSLGLLSST
ncbi:WbqC family protein [Thalassospiraceae bacterium LMO-JJ14]|nr:WbqC family protein [Thalassospiraceae bacterium LMO-JJ14]